MSTNETKLQRHARRFLACSSPETVLKKYDTKVASMQQKELQRHLCHICAWIVLAPSLTDAAVAIGQSGVSPVHVLSKLLLLRGHAPLSERLKEALRAVNACCNVIEQSEAEQQLLAAWHELHMRVPAACKRSRNNTTKRAREHPLADEDTFWFKRQRRLNNSIVKWTALDLTEQRDRALALEGRLNTLLQAPSIDTLDLRKLLYDTIGALAPPRARPSLHLNLDPMDDESVHRLRSSAESQKIIRRILACALDKWRNDLALEDAQIEPILTRIRGHIQTFEHAHGDIHRACASSQWHRLYELLDSGSAVNDRGKNKRHRTEFWKSRGSTNVMPKGLIEELMRTAMARLEHQEGTYEDIVRMITTETDLQQRAAGNLDCRRKTFHGKPLSILEWHQRVAERMPKFFLKSARKKSGKVVWKSRTQQLWRQ